jgi:hypothetical protein
MGDLNRDLAHFNRHLECPHRGLPCLDGHGSRLHQGAADRHQFTTRLHPFCEEEIVLAVAT